MSYPSGLPLVAAPDVPLHTVAVGRSCAIHSIMTYVAIGQADAQKRHEQNG
jgi:hypothetical protein